MISGTGPDTTPDGAFLSGAVDALSASSLAQFYGINVLGASLNIPSANPAHGVIQVTYLGAAKVLSCILFIPASTLCFAWDSTNLLAS